MVQVVAGTIAIDFTAGNIRSLLSVTDVSMTSDSIRMSWNDNSYLAMRGRFSVSNGVLLDGVITSMEEVYGGETLYRMSRLNYDVDDFRYQLILGSSQSFLSSVLDGNDEIEGSALADVLYAYDGSDVLCGRAGADRLNGGYGSDTASYTGSPGGVEIRLAEGWAADGFGSVDTLTGIENAIGTDFDDTLTGAYGGSSLYGQGGNDVILSVAGGSLLYGQGGNDTIAGATGADVLYGGDGSDLLFGSESGDHLEGGADSDVLLGGEDGDVVLGGSGVDLLGGGAGADLLDGGEGADGIDGGAGNDTILGGAGADTIVPDAGNDQIRGGSDADVFVFSPEARAVKTIWDFTPGEDRLDFRGGISKAELLAGAVVTDGGSLILSYGDRSCAVLVNVSTVDTSWFT